MPKISSKLAKLPPAGTPMVPTAAIAPRGVPGIPLYNPSNYSRRDKWREYFNPLWQLNVPTVVARLQASQMGIMSDIQWIYRFIERRNPTMIALIARRRAALGKLDWDVKALPESMLPAGATLAMAEKQRIYLRSKYDLIDNIKQANAFLGMATFRGYSHLERHYNKDGDVIHFEPVPQWNWARDGIFGAWWYNRGAYSVYGGGGGTEQIDEANFLIRESDYPIDEVAVISFIRKNVALRDWDSFIASYGIPPLFIEMPQDVPAEFQDAYQAAAEQVSSNSRGVLPFGAKPHTIPDAGRGKTPFESHIDYLDKQIVLAGTGGKLTMLTESGSGQLAGGAHTDTFDEIALDEASDVTEVWQTQFDKPQLASEFPDEPVLAYFEIAAKEQEDTTAKVAEINTLAQAGYEVDPDQIEEITGLRITIRPPVNKTVQAADQGNASIRGGGPPPTSNRHSRPLVDGQLRNRRHRNDAPKTSADYRTQETLLSNSSKQLYPIYAYYLKALAMQYKRDVLSGNPDTIQQRSDTFLSLLPDVLRKMASDGRTDDILTGTLTAGVLNGAEN